MTDKRQRFVAEYLVDLNATAACTRVGYSEKSAGRIAKRLMKNPEIIAAIAKGKEKRLDRIGISAERVLAELELLAFSDLENYVVDDDGNVLLKEGAPAGAHRALQSIKRRTVTSGSGENARTVREVEIKLWDKVTPLIRAGRHVDVHGFSDRVEHTGKDGAPIQTVTLYQIPANGREAE